MNIIQPKWNWNGQLTHRNKTDYIALHHAEAVVCTAQQVDEWHKSNGWAGIGYHFFVRKNGEIYAGRPIDTVGAHVQGMNSCSIGICAEGDYHNKDKVMPEAQKKSIKWLISEMKKKYPNAKIVGHREIGDSNCPGQYYPLEEMKKSYNVSEEDEPMTAEERSKMEAIDKSLSNLYTIVEGLKKEVENKMIYDYIDDNMPAWAHAGVQYCLDHGIIQGTGDGKLGLDDKDLKYCTIIMRALEGNSN